MKKKEIEEEIISQEIIEEVPEDIQEIPEDEIIKARKDAHQIELRR